MARPTEHMPPELKEVKSEASLAEFRRNRNSLTYGAHGNWVQHGELHHINTSPLRRNPNDISKRFQQLYNLAPPRYASFYPPNKARRAEMLKAAQEAIFVPPSNRLNLRAPPGSSAATSASGSVADYPHAMLTHTQPPAIRPPLLPDSNPAKWRLPLPPSRTPSRGSTPASAVASAAGGLGPLPPPLPPGAPLPPEADGAALPGPAPSTPPRLDPHDFPADAELGETSEPLSPQDGRAVSPHSHYEWLKHSTGAPKQQLKNPSRFLDMLQQSEVWEGPGEEVSLVSSTPELLGSASMPALPSMLPQPSSLRKGPQAEASRPGTTASFRKNRLSASAGAVQVVSPDKVQCAALLQSRSWGSLHERPRGLGYFQVDEAEREQRRALEARLMRAEVEGQRARQLESREMKRRGGGAGEAGDGHINSLSSESTVAIADALKKANLAKREQGAAHGDKAGSATLFKKKMRWQVLAEKEGDYELRDGFKIPKGLIQLESGRKKEGGAEQAAAPQRGRRAVFKLATGQGKQVGSALDKVRGEMGGDFPGGAAGGELSAVALQKAEDLRLDELQKRAQRRRSRRASRLSFLQAGNMPLAVEEEAPSSLKERVSKAAARGGRRRRSSVMLYSKLQGEMVEVNVRGEGPAGGFSDSEGSEAEDEEDEEVIGIRWMGHQEALQRLLAHPSAAAVARDIMSLRTTAAVSVLVSLAAAPESSVPARPAEQAEEAMMTGLELVRACLEPEAMPVHMSASLLAAMTEDLLHSLLKAMDKDTKHEVTRRMKERQRISAKCASTFARLKGMQDSDALFLLQTFPAEECAEVVNNLSTERAADICQLMARDTLVSLIEHLNPYKAGQICTHMPLDKAYEAVSGQSDPLVAQRLLEQMNTDQCAEVVGQCAEAAEAAALLRPLEEDRAARILSKMPSEQAAAALSRLPGDHQVAVLSRVGDVQVVAAMVTKMEAPLAARITEALPAAEAGHLLTAFAPDHRKTVSENMTSEAVAAAVPRMGAGAMGELLRALEAGRLAEVFEQLDPRSVSNVVQIAGPAVLLAMLQTQTTEQAARSLGGMPQAAAAALLAGLEAEAAAALLEHLPAPGAARLLAGMEAVGRAAAVLALMSRKHGAAALDALEDANRTAELLNRMEGEGGGEAWNELVRRMEPEKATVALTRMHTHKAAHLFDSLDVGSSAKLLARMNTEEGAEMLRTASHEAAAGALQSLDAPTAGAMLTRLHPDRMARLLEHLPDDAAGRVLSHLDTAKAGQVVARLSPKKTARLVEGMEPRRGCAVLQMDPSVGGQVLAALRPEYAARFFQESDALPPASVAALVDQIPVSYVAKLFNPVATHILIDIVVAMDHVKSTQVLEYVQLQCAARVLEVMDPSAAAERLGRFEHLRSADVMRQLPLAAAVAVAEAGRPERLARTLEKFHPQQAAEVVGAMQAAAAGAVLDHMAPKKAGPMFALVRPRVAQKDLLVAMQPDAAAKVMSVLTLSIALELVSMCARPTAAAIVSRMDAGVAGVLLSNLQGSALVAIFEHVEPKRAGRLMQSMPDAAAVEALGNIDSAHAGQILRHTTQDVAVAIMQRMKVMQAAAVLEVLPPPDAAPIIMLLEEPAAAAILTSLGPLQAAHILQETQIDRAAVFLYRLGKPFSAQALCMMEDAEKAAQVLLTLDVEYMAHLLSAMTDSGRATDLLQKMPVMRVAIALPQVRSTMVTSVLASVDVGTGATWLRWLGVKESVELLERLEREDAAKLLLAMHSSERSLILAMLDASVETEVHRLRNAQILLRFQSKEKAGRFCSMCQAVLEHGRMAQQALAQMPSMRSSLEELRAHPRPDSTTAALITALAILTSGPEVAGVHVKWTGEYSQDEGSALAQVRGMVDRGPQSPTSPSRGSGLAVADPTVQAMHGLVQALRTFTPHFFDQAKYLLLCRAFANKNIDTSKARKVASAAQRLHTWIKLVLALFAHTTTAKHWVLGQDGELIEASQQLTSSMRFTRG